MRSLDLQKNRFYALAILCLFAGLVLTLDNLDYLPGAWRMWPIFPLALGAGGIMLFKKNPVDIIPLGIGIFLVLISIFFCILNFSSWLYMSKLWPTFIGVFGAALLAVARYSGKRRWFLASGFFFIFLSTAFFVVFALDGKLWPISLILFGVWLLILPDRSYSEKKGVNS